MKAWLVTWEWCGPSAAVADKVAAILPPRLGERRVADIVQLLHVLATCDLSDVAAYAKRPRKAPDQPRLGEVINAIPHGERITCGHNPMLYARPVTNLRTWEEDDREVIEWEEPPTFRWKDERQMEVEVASEGWKERVRRSMQGPLRNDLVWDRLVGALRQGYEDCDLGS